MPPRRIPLINSLRDRDRQLRDWKFEYYRLKRRVRDHRRVVKRLVAASERVYNEEDFFIRPPEFIRELKRAFTLVKKTVFH